MVLALHNFITLYTIAPPSSFFFGDMGVKKPSRNFADDKYQVCTLAHIRLLVYCTLLYFMCCTYYTVLVLGAVVVVRLRM